MIQNQPTSSIKVLSELRGQHTGTENRQGFPGMLDLAKAVPESTFVDKQKTMDGVGLLFSLLQQVFNAKRTMHRRQRGWVGIRFGHCNQHHAQQLMLLGSPVVVEGADPMVFAPQPFGQGDGRASGGGGGGGGENWGWCGHC